MHIAVACQQLLPAKGYGGRNASSWRWCAGSRRSAIASRCSRHRARESRSRCGGRASAQAGRPAALAPYIPRDVEIVHAHFPMRGGPGAFPFVQTIHRNLKAGTAPYPNSIFLSRDHARRHNSDVFVYNGLDPADYVFRRFPRRPVAVRLVPRQAPQRKAITGRWKPRSAPATV